MTILNKLSFAAMFAIAAAAAAAPAAAQEGPQEYAAKFVCGATSRATMVVPGAYLTAVNVHNPGGSDDDIRWRVTLAGSLSPGGVTEFERFALRKGEALDIDCRILAKRLAASNITVAGAFTGFLVIRSRRALDVVAVYTAAVVTSTNGPGNVVSFHTERVPPRPFRD
jgi:hypothetical protein